MGRRIMRGTPPYTDVARTRAHCHWYPDGLLKYPPSVTDPRIEREANAPPPPSRSLATGGPLPVPRHPPCPKQPGLVPRGLAGCWRAGCLLPRREQGLATSGMGGNEYTAAASLPASTGNPRHPVAPAPPFGGKLGLASFTLVAPDNPSIVSFHPSIRRGRLWFLHLHLQTHHLDDLASLPLPPSSSHYLLLHPPTRLTAQSRQPPPVAVTASIPIHLLVPSGAVFRRRLICMISRPDTTSTPASITYAHRREFPTVRRQSTPPRYPPRAVPLPLRPPYHDAPR